MTKTAVMSDDEDKSARKALLRVIRDLLEKARRLR